MEHLDTGTLEDWYANRAMPAPTLLRRLAVIAPDDAPGLSALRQRLAQRGPQALNCDHYAAGFNGRASAGLASAFEQIRQRHEADPYDIVLLLEGRPEALGIAESNGLIPEQVSRMPAPVWTAIDEDDANTVLGDVANRVFPNTAALIDALPLPGVQAQAAAVRPEPETKSRPVPAAEPLRQSAAAPAFSLVTTPDEVAPGQLLTLPSRHETLTPERASAHPLVLCAAGAVIVASITAVAAMLGWLPSSSRVHANAGATERAAATATVAPAAAPATTLVTGTPAAPGSVMNAADTVPATPPATTTTEPVSDPAAPMLPTPPAQQSSGSGEGAALAAVGAAGLAAAVAGEKATTPAPVKRVRPAPRRSNGPKFAQAQAPRQVGSTEVPSVDFVGTKSRQQVIAELMEARRATNQQAANGNYFIGPGGPSARR